MGISDKGSGRDFKKRDLQKRCGTISIVFTERQEDGNGGSGDKRQCRLQHQRYGVTEVVVCGGGKRRPDPAKQNE